MSASEPTIDSAGRQFSAVARRPLYYLAGVIALFFVGLLIISVHDRDFMYPQENVIYERLANVCTLAAAIGVIYLVAARTYRRQDGPMERALLLFVPTLGAPLFLCLPLMAARKLRRAHSPL